MRAAQIVYEFPSVSETFVLAQIRGLIERGWDVRIFADGKGSHANLTGDAHELENLVSYFGLPLKRVRELVGRVLSNTPAGPSRVQSEKTRRNALESIRLKLEERAFAHAGKFHIVHAHFGPNGVRAMRLRESGVLTAPVVTSFYGYDVTRHWARNGYRELFELGDCFIALSETMKQQLTGMGAPPARTIVHRLGVDVSRFDRNRPSHSEGTRVLSIARLVEKKGIEFGIRAVAKVSQHIPGLTYTIAGDGPMRSRLEKLAAALKVQNNVRFLGAQSRAQVEALLSRSDILLAPSVTAVDGDTEGTPVAILEAQAAGIPVVSTRHGGIHEIVQDSVSGYLAEERDVDALADRLAELASSESLRARFGAAGRQFVMQHHDIHRLNDELVKTYGSLIAQ